MARKPWKTLAHVPRGVPHTRGNITTNPRDLIGEKFTWTQPTLSLGIELPHSHINFFKMPLPQLLVGKVAAITGGLTGIGRVSSPRMSIISKNMPIQFRRSHA